LLQEKFKIALDAGDLELALEVMDKFPSQEPKIDGMSEKEIIRLRADRLVTLKEGYEVIAKSEASETYMGLGEPNEIQNRLDELGAYKELGTLEELEALKDSYDDISRSLE